MSKLAAGAGCDITDDELKNSINQHRIIMWRDRICIDSMPDSSRIAMAYPVTEEDTSNMVYRDLCFHLTNDSALVADTAIIGRLKNAEALSQQPIVTSYNRMYQVMCYCFSKPYDNSQ